MKTKKCFKCLITQNLNEFYPHPQTADGHLNKCKSCTKKDVKLHRVENIDKIREYDRVRGNRQTDEYYNSDVYKNSHKIANAKYNNLNKEKCRARCKVSRALKKGLIKKGFCEVCGETETEAHHEDYSKPLDVNWLCDKHHKARHKAKNEEARKKCRQIKDSDK